MQAFHPTWDASYARDLLESFALDPSKKVKELSKGMRAQAGLIAAVAHRPELLILDEPSSGLDAVVRRDILDAIVRTVADDGRTVICTVPVPAHPMRSHGDRHTDGGLR